ncbi:cation transporter, partial [Francisella tularensis subsp. holarctica]|uniref:cation transporter n=1 Tax=Francisella tularensis TaxID=263 RepID=UPI0023819755
HAWHSRSDRWSSVVVVVGFFGAFLGFAWMDAIAAFIVCFMIVKMGVKWGYSAVAEIIDEGVDDQTLQDIKAIIAKTQGV